MVTRPSREPTTLVIQSFRATDVPAWLTRCTQSVATWARACGYTYRYLGDELFAPLPTAFRRRTEHRSEMMADLGRLLALQAALAEGFERAVWFDADVIVFAPSRLVLPEGRDFYMCREVWVEPERDGGVRVDRRINNAACVFSAGASFLPFYIDAAQQLVADASGQLPNTLVGTQFLTGLDRVVRLPAIERVGLVSPYALRELATAGDGPCVRALHAASSTPLAAVNLCNAFRGTTVRQPDGVSWVQDDAVYEAAIEHLVR